MNAYKRLLFIGIVIITLVISFLVFIPKRVHRSQSYIPEALQGKLAQEGCFYNSAEDCYQITGVDFGRELYEMVADLGLEKWYTKEKIDSIYQSLSGDSKSAYSDTMTVSAFDAKYSFSFRLSKGGECYQISMMGSFVSDSQTPIPYENVMDYGDACKYGYNLFNEFVASYGEPDVSSFPEDLNEITIDGFTSDREVYARWITGEVGHQSVLGLRAGPFHTGDTDLYQFVNFNVYIYIGQETEGISIDDIFV